MSLQRIANNSLRSNSDRLKTLTAVDGRVLRVTETVTVFLPLTTRVLLSDQEGEARSLKRVMTNDVMTSSSKVGFRLHTEK